VLQYQNSKYFGSKHPLTLLSPIKKPSINRLRARPCENDFSFSFFLYSLNKISANLRAGSSVHNAARAGSALQSASDEACVRPESISEPCGRHGRRRAEGSAGPAAGEVEGAGEARTLLRLRRWLRLRCWRRNHRR